MRPAPQILAAAGVLATPLSPGLPANVLRKAQARTQYRNLCHPSGPWFQPGPTTAIANI